jgi:O-antigen/teichoic acid export membrane protein
MLPLYTRTLTPSEVGAYEWFTAISMSLLAVLPLEITQAVAHLRTQKLDDETLRRQVRTAFSFTLLVFGIFAVVVTVASQMLSGMVLGGRFESWLIICSAWLLFLNGVLYFLQNELRWTLQAKQYALTSLATAVVTAAAALIFLAMFDLGLLGLYGALILGVAAGILLAIRCMPQQPGWRIERGHLAAMLAFSAPFAVASLSIILATTIDRIMIAQLLNLESLGQYGVALRIASVAMLAFQGFQLAVLPATVGQRDGARRESSLEQSFRIFLLIAIAIAIGLGAVAPEVLSLVATDAYRGSEVYIPVLLIGIVFSAAYPFAPGLWLRGHTKRMGLIGICIVLVGLSANFTLIPLAGSMGAALAYAVTGLSYCLVMFWASDRVLPVGRRYAPLVLACIAFMAGCIAMAWMLAAQEVLAFRIVLAVVVTILSACLLTSRDERRNAIGKLGSQWGKF